MDVYIIMVVFAGLADKMTIFRHCLYRYDIVGAANPFLAMVMIGIGFEFHSDRKDILRIGGILLNRYLTASVLAWLFYHYAPFDTEIRKLLVIIVFAPVSAVCTIFTAKSFD